MKRFLIYAFACCVLMAAQSTWAQTNKDYPNFSSKKRILYEDAQGDEILELTGNVACETAKVKIRNAQQLFYNKKTGKIIVEGLAKFTTQGKVINRVSNGAKPKRFFFYVNDDTIYIE
ncbi:MAG TPA: hypothetical protein DCS93_23635 [Microscillaceae bacterium]|nr:hypothetical protein [Microscillaceae bacterium]